MEFVARACVAAFAVFKVIRLAFLHCLCVCLFRRERSQAGTWENGSLYAVLSLESARATCMQSKRAARHAEFYSELNHGTHCFLLEKSFASVDIEARSFLMLKVY